MKPQILFSAKDKGQIYLDAVNGCGGSGNIEYCPKPDTGYDGLILCGGSDVHPKYYGQKVNGSVDIDDERDIAEFKLVDAFIRAGKPIMGICRGCQILNIALGGTLIQDIPNAEKHRRINDVDSAHQIIAEQESVLSSLYGESFFVNSAHHQAIDVIGKELKITAFSSEDGVIEAFEHITLPVFGVQWHPERMCFSKARPDTVDGAELFKFFLRQCKACM